MCLVAFALDQSSRFPFVLAANRDEFFDRPASRLGWWDPGHGGPAILGGRDLHAGGTWLGLTALGRLGLITNVRDPQHNDPMAPTRGEIVPQWLKGETHLSMLWPRLAMTGYNGFNLIALDFAQGECFWANNQRVMPERLQRGIFGLSNAQLNTPWPKVQALKANLRHTLTEAMSAQEIADDLFESLASPTPAVDEELPHTGVSLEWERMLSPAFIRSPNNQYGTRCSTVIVAERANKRLVTYVWERTFSAQSPLALMRSLTLRNWPPRHTMSPSEVSRLDASLPPAALRHDESFESSDIAELENHQLDAAAVKRHRARNLIKSPASLAIKA